MNDHQQPMDEKQTAAAQDPVEIEPLTDPEAEPEDIDPAEVHIFGMPRIGFHCTAFGAALGYIVCGLLGIAGFQPPNATICAVAGGAVGHLLGRHLYQKQHAAREAAKQAAEASEHAE